jgi:hypothetical protein
MVISQISCGLSAPRADLAIGRIGRRITVGQKETRAQLFPGEPLQPAMQCGLEGEQHGRHHARGGRSNHVHHGEGAEGECQHGGYRGCRAIGLGVLDLTPAEEHDGGREHRKGKTQGQDAPGAKRPRQGSPDAAEQSG